MSLGSMLQQKCKITRRDETATDRLHDVDPNATPTTLAANHPCRLSRITRGSETFSQIGAGAEFVTHMLYIEPIPGVTLTAGDRIADVRDPSGMVLATDLDIKAVRRVSKRRGFLNHLELPCVELRDGDKS